jgi:hypothetical protein
MTVLWYAFFQGDLCRLRRRRGGSLVSEVWRNGLWVAGPDFAEVDFRGRAIAEDEAMAWIRTRFRTKKVWGSSSRGRRLDPKGRP